MAAEVVTHAVVEMLVNLADQLDAPLAALCEGMPFDAHALRHRTSELKWDLVVELLDRLEARAGAERIVGLCATIQDVSPTGRGILRHFVSARLLMRFVCTVMGPTMYPMYDASWTEGELPDGAVEGHLRLALKPGFRSCPLIFRMHGPAMAAVPCFIGHPLLAWREETSGRHGDYWYRL
ncbi:MAG: hypothetical protein IT380_23960 [Myxococcales bacterium]|nr:hypothetical protein [Myxococcales bacterium]